ncbi:MAG: hypothetical protein FWH47_04700 [Methanomassiliicoccaceae archaeon]|nr:hypothetical protein [Methanomassiliicoccaceae archaeon]
MPTEDFDDYEGTPEFKQFEVLSVIRDLLVVCKQMMLRDHGTEPVFLDEILEIVEDRAERLCRSIFGGE